MSKELTDHALHGNERAVRAFPEERVSPAKDDLRHILKILILFHETYRPLVPGAGCCGFYKLAVTGGLESLIQ